MQVGWVVPSFRVGLERNEATDAFKWIMRDDGEFVLEGIGGGVIS